MGLAVGSPHSPTLGLLPPPDPGYPPPSCPPPFRNMAVSVHTPRRSHHSGGLSSSLTPPGFGLAASWRFWLPPPVSSSLYTGTEVAGLPVLC